MVFTVQNTRKVIPYVRLKRHSGENTILYAETGGVPVKGKKKSGRISVHDRIFAIKTFRFRYNSEGNVVIIYLSRVSSLFFSSS